MQLSYESSVNSLRLTLSDVPQTATARIGFTGYVDMGAGGRLVGIELLGPAAFDLRQAMAAWLTDSIASEYVSVADGSAYIELSAATKASMNEQSRSVAAVFDAELDSAGQLVAVLIPRHGAGYEITYPSGNQ